MQDSNQKITTKEQASFTELLDEREGVILDLENLHYYTLNAAAVFLWQQLCAGAATTAEALGEALAATFRLNPEQAFADTRRFLTELAGNGLLGSGAEAVAAGPQGASILMYEARSGYEPPRLRLANSLTQVMLSGSATIATSALATGG